MTGLRRGATPPRSRRPTSFGCRASPRPSTRAACRRGCGDAAGHSPPRSRRTRRTDPDVRRDATPCHRTRRATRAVAVTHARTSRRSGRTSATFLRWAAVAVDVSADSRPRSPATAAARTRPALPTPRPPAPPETPLRATSRPWRRHHTIVRLSVDSRRQRRSSSREGSAVRAPPRR